MKVLSILILLFIFVIGFIILMLYIAGKKIKEKTEIIENLYSQCRRKDSKINELTKENEIEKKYNERLVEKLSKISNMSTFDILKQLQNNTEG